jgi:hypothetical protein
MPECVDGDGARSKGGGEAGKRRFSADWSARRRRRAAVPTDRALQDPESPEPSCQAKGKSSCAAGGPRVERK